MEIVYKILGNRNYGMDFPEFSRHSIKAKVDTRALTENFTRIIQGMALREKESAKKSDLFTISEIALKTLNNFMIKKLSNKKAHRLSELVYVSGSNLN